MEESSESTWQKSSSSKELIASTSERNPLNQPSYFDSEIQKVSVRVVLASQNLKKQFGLADAAECEIAGESFRGDIEGRDVSLRQWLDNPERLVNEFECLHIFRQIVEIVHTAHSQGIFVHNIRPSCFVMSSFNHVSFIESASCSDSDSNEEGSSTQTGDFKNSSYSGRGFNLTSNLGSERSFTANTEYSFMQTSSVYEAQVPLKSDFESNLSRGLKAFEEDEKKLFFPMKKVLGMEVLWYNSPEEIAGCSSSFASDIYKLGVILFELFCDFNSREDKRRTMASLKDRVLPVQLLRKWQKVATFCLWLLHPDPASRPKMGEVLQSEFLNERRDNLEEREAATEVKQSIEEQEMLLEFLMMMQKRKQEVIDKLQNTIGLLSSDIEEVLKYQNDLKAKGNTLRGTLETKILSGDVVPRKRIRFGFPSSNDDTQNSENTFVKSDRLMINFKKLESAYFVARCKPLQQPRRVAGNHGAVSNNAPEGSINSLASKEVNEESRIGWIGQFHKGLCKYLAYSKMKVKADLKQNDLYNSSNLVCSIGFDRDCEFFATAGINKKIKVFECDLLVNDNKDFHYPVLEMSSRSKLCCVSWNSYIKSQIASSNFEGSVQVWDVNRNQVVAEMKEHGKRVWSVDFSVADPTTIASGSDDCSVKIWNINQGSVTRTIKTKANVCSVQFSSDSSNYLAFGSADHMIYYYDLRNARSPLSTYVGHSRTVSYVKFLSPSTIVSSSTDNTLKLWNLQSASRVVRSPVQTYTGHSNVKNFVGLSVSDGYIATGSESNEIYVYNKEFAMPALSFKFQNEASNDGNEVEESAQFISSVCWRGQSTTLVAANSAGNIKVLEMV